MKTIVKSVVALAVLASASASANWSGNLGVSSDYLWRGVTQSAGNPAVSGGLDYAHDNGFYAGLWGSSVDFGDDTTYEMDVYGGYSNVVGDLSYDLNYTYYAYPNAADAGMNYDADFGELSLGLGYGYFGLTVAYGINADDFVIYDKALYVEGNVSIPLSDSVAVFAAVGHQSFDSEYTDIGAAEDYVNYHIGLTKTTDMGDVSFLISDTDEDGADPIALVQWTFGFDL